jgi:7,8-dihydroneopterin aldolase/epimerase/oxygenase
MDKILIRNLRVQGIIGILPEERVNKQTVLLNIVLYVDSRPAAVSDDITDTVSYHNVALRVKEYVENSAHFLVEKLANSLGDLILAEFAVKRVILRLEKPDILPFADSVGIEIERPYRK